MSRTTNSKRQQAQEQPRLLHGTDTARASFAPMLAMVVTW